MANPDGRRRLVSAALLAAPPARRLVEQRDQLASQVQQLKRRNAGLRAARRRLRSELRDAESRAARSLDADDADLGYLFIVTYGRSGSTLLQGIISSIPGYLIRGENAGVAYQLHRFHATASRRSSLDKARWQAPESAWYGMGGYPQELALHHFRRLLLSTVIRPEGGARVVGFKEIRWMYDDLHEYVDFLRAVFPGARFVVNTRNLDDVVVSKWWADKPNARQTLEEAQARMLALLDRLGDDAYHVHYDDYVHSIGKLRGLFEWLGEEFDEARVAEVMTRRHSY